MTGHKRKGMTMEGEERSVTPEVTDRKRADKHAEEPEIRETEEELLLLYGKNEFLPYIDAIRSGCRSHGCSTR